MKRIAIFVEGQTEQIFVNKLLIEIAGQKNLAIELMKFSGKGKAKIQIPHSNLATSTAPSHGVLIYDCGGDEGVKTRILEEYQSLFEQNYLEVIGIRDLYPLTDLEKLENRLSNGLPTNTSIVVAVNEIEAWFLADYEHFTQIDAALTKVFIQLKSAVLGFDPYVDDPIARPQPSRDLNAIYQLAGKSYTKKKKNAERTIECLDYAQIYVTFKPKIAKLGEFISKIDLFLS
jgi:hypothetical protein